MLLLSIKYKIFIAQFFLILVLVSALSYRLYNIHIDNYMQSLIGFYEDSSSWIVNRASLSMSGDNYANMQLSDFVEYLSRSETLLFFKAYGYTDISSKPYEIIYDRALGEVYRAYYSDEHMETIETKITLFESKLQDTNEDNVKIKFLLNRLYDAKKEYEISKEYTALVNQKYLELLDHQGVFFDNELGLLVLELKTSNKNGGYVKLIYDISHIKAIENETIKNIIFEVFWVLLFSIFVLWIISSKIIKHLDNLTKYISKDFNTIDASAVPHVDDRDEIGMLAKSFQAMLFQMNNYIQRLEELSKNDPLTGLYNRRAFDEIFSNTLKKNKTKYIALLYMDIDNFKKYNDNYGHNLGDVALQGISKAISASLHRSGDYVFRLGGEEFAIMLSVDSKEDAIEIAERVRKSILDLKIEHVYNHPLNILSISIGLYITLNNHDLQLLHLLQKADEALYKAKENGRNRVEMTL